ncbi:MAG: insulinase family protein [Bdellovibrionales bacterium]|nr:insulinase family protein [Bdellovibrionales bacterium]
MFKKYQLKNGLKVLLVESHKSPVLSIQMWVKTGSADEKKGEEGISHFIEHLVFKGSQKFNVGEIASTVEAAGGELNAYTSFDQTVFYVTISKEFQKVGLEVISEMMGFPKFDEKEIDNEREVVIEEIKRSNDSPHRQASRLLFETMYAKHPYGIPVIGYSENIYNVSRKTLLNYFHSRYNPKNMTLVVAGDFAAPEMKKQVQDFFGAFPPNRLRVVKRAKNVVARKPSLVVKTAPFAETIVHLAFPAPKASHKDIAALEMFALVVGQGESSRLNQRMRMNEHLVNYAGTSVFLARDPGFLAVSMSLNEKDLGVALEALREELVRALSEPMSEDERRKALTNMASEQFYTQETVDGLARNYGHYQDLFDDPSHFEKFLRQAEKLTSADILKVARKYLTAQNFSLVVQTPAEQKTIEPQAQKWIKETAASLKKVAGVKTKAAKPTRGKKISFVFRKAVGDKVGVEKHVLKNGITVITRPSFETPVISVRCASLGGARLEGQDNQGATELLSRVWTAGCGPYSEAVMNRRIDEMAASLSAFSGRNSEGLSMSCLRTFEKEMLELLCLTYKEPQFEQAAITREIKSMQEHVKLRKDNPAQLCVLEFMKNLFPGHPYGRDVYGDEVSIGRLKATDVREIYARKQGLTIVASGALDPKEFRQRIEDQLGDVEPGNGGNPLYPLKYPPQDIRVFLESVKEQSHIIMGYPGLTLKDPERYTLQVIQAILAGQGGRLFLELRDKNSLAYSVSPMRMEGLEGGYFGAYIGCSPEKADKALRMMNIEFSKLVEHKVPDVELARAQRYLIGKHDIELQRNSNITSALLFDEIYGIDYMETYHFTERIRAVTSDSILKLAKRLFSQPTVTSLVGPSAPW